MEAVVTTSLLAGRSQYERSCLPTLAQLNLHVDGADLLRRLEARPMTGDQLEQLAQANHQVYCDDLRARGYRYGPKTDNALQEREALVSWAELPEGLKQQNREAVADIESKLQTIGAMIVRSTGNEPPFQFTDAEIDRLSRDEHLRWNKSKLADGWRYGPERDNDALVHPALLPWPVGEDPSPYTPDELSKLGPHELPEYEKEKDRAQVRGIPTVLDRAGYTIVRRT